MGGGGGGAGHMPRNERNPYARAEVAKRRAPTLTNTGEIVTP